MSARRDEVIGKIDGLIARLDKELTAVRADASLRAACVRPLEALREQVRAQESLAHITQAESEAEREYDRAMMRIETLVATPIAATGGGRGGPGDQQTPPTPPAPIRKRRIVTPAKIMTTPYLETPDDVNGFLDDLRRELETALANNERIEIR